jgi:hypothetical protein
VRHEKFLIVCRGRFSSRFPRCRARSDTARGCLDADAQHQPQRLTPRTAHPGSLLSPSATVVIVSSGHRGIRWGNPDDGARLAAYRTRYAHGLRFPRPSQLGLPTMNRRYLTITDNTSGQVHFVHPAVWIAARSPGRGLWVSGVR